MSEQKIKSIRGMNDILPKEIYKWNEVEKILISILKESNFKEIRTPILEHTNLFYRGIGEFTDIVSKETYNFIDKNGDNLCLKPEGTASCVRSMIEHNLFREGIQKLFYLSPMFRRERPQKGRYRQFYQLGIEIFGNDDISSDAEILLLTWEFFTKFKLDKNILLEINNLGTNEQRENFKKDLVIFLEENIDILDEDSKNRLYKNPLRILDSKNKNVQNCLKNSPKIYDYLDNNEKNKLNDLKKILENLKVPYVINYNLVRGIDYYSNIVFEWTTNLLGSQTSVCAGGRYNNLIAELNNGKSVPSLGCALGFERFLLLLETINYKFLEKVPDIYILSSNEYNFLALKLALQIKNLGKKLIVETNTQSSSIKAKFKKANKSQAKYTIIICENEVKENFYTIKNMNTNQEFKVLQSDLESKFISII